jgi:hypothetical protein
MSIPCKKTHVVLRCKGNILHTVFNVLIIFYKNRLAYGIIMTVSSDSDVTLLIAVLNQVTDFN